MFLMRHPAGSEPSCYELDDYDGDIGKRSCKSKREPRSWPWTSWSGSGVTAIGRTKEEAERLLHERFWSDAA